MFSDKDPANKGRDSVEMLTLAVRRAKDRGYRVVQVDVTIVTESPRLEAHKEAMRDRLADPLGLGRNDVSIKAKSNEGMGWIGRGEGIACMAVASVDSE